MKKKNLSYVYLLLLIFAIGILGFTTVSGVAAAEPNITSDDQSSVMNMKIMGVSVLKNGDPVSTIVYDGEGGWDKAETTTLFGSDASLKVGETIDASLTIANGIDNEDEKINVYTRVIIYKYWMEDNEKDFSADPAKIHVALKNVSGNVNSDLGWNMVGNDEDAAGTWLLDSQTNEKIILYYDSLLEAGDVSAEFMKGLEIDGSIKNDYKTEYLDDGKTIIGYDYLYNGKSIKIEVELDAIQDHSAEKAIKAAWGKNVTVNDGNLSLND